MRKVHGVAGFMAFIAILIFFTSTVTVELLGSYEAVAMVKRGILYGLFILVPAMAAAGTTGFKLGSMRSNRLVSRKKKRMRFIGANGILVLLPSAVYLDYLASTGDFGAGFYAIQALELAAGAVNISLMFMNIRDGLRLAARSRPGTTVEYSAGPTY